MFIKDHGYKFNHPLANDIEWSPITKGGNYFQSHVLDTTVDNLMVFKPSFAFIAMGIIFLLFSLCVTVYPLVIVFNETMGRIDYSLIILSFMGLIFSILSGLGLYTNYQSKYFDTFKGLYYQAKSHVECDLSAKHSDYLPIQSIVAIQIIKKQMDIKNKKNVSFELNLILEDKSRINVINHSKIDTLRNDGQTITTTLGVPLWDAS